MVSWASWGTPVLWFKHYNVKQWIPAICLQLFSGFRIAKETSTRTKITRRGGKEAAEGKDEEKNEILNVVVNL